MIEISVEQYWVRERNGILDLDSLKFFGYHFLVREVIHVKRVFIKSMKFKESVLKVRRLKSSVEKINTILYVMINAKLNALFVRYIRDLIFWMDLTNIYNYVCLNVSSSRIEDTLSSFFGWSPRPCKLRK